MKAIILAGGSGTRLWPLSRQSYPKQFLKLDKGNSLLELTAKRLLKLVAPEDIIVITNCEYRFHVKSDLDSLSSGITNMVLEPAKRNTAPAIALTVRYCVEKLKCHGDEVLFIAPSDHIVKPEETFIEYVKNAVDIARNGYIVTFGIKPTRPETGYGYIKTRKDPYYHGDFQFFEVEMFTEKPDIDKARQYIEEGSYYWNSGMFAFTIDTISEEFKKYAPGINSLFEKGLDRLLKDFERMPDISIDYAIMEKSDKVITFPMDLYWNDIGSWDCLFEVFERDDNGNVTTGDVLKIDTKNTLIMGDKRLITTIGVEGLLIVETGDAILIAKRGDAQRVKDIVDILNSRGRREASEHRTIYRPWGEYTILEEGARYKIKRIVVKPGEKLSLQMHHHRSEHWVVVKGTAKVTINDKELYIHENESAYVPKSTPHRLENPGKVPLEIIEVQNGEYVGEDDIKRLDDYYGRL